MKRFLYLKSWLKILREIRNEVPFDNHWFYQCDLNANNPDSYESKIYASIFNDFLLIRCVFHVLPQYISVGERGLGEIMFNISDFTAWKIGDGSLEGKDVLCWSRKDGYYFLKSKDAFYDNVVGVRND